MQKEKTKHLIIAIAIPLVVGGISALITMNSMEKYEELPKPPLAPPSFLFPIVWTILFILMGIASYLIYSAPDSIKRRRSLEIYAVQLAVNFFWPIFFFNMQAFIFSFIWLLLLWILIIATIVYFSMINLKAAALLIPYFLWVTFAGYLNLYLAINV